MASCNAKHIENLIMKLSLESDSKIKRALLELTKLTKNKENVDLFCLKGGLRQLFILIKRPNKTIADMALSTLANCARESESRREIRRLDGIALLGVVLKTINQTSILNRTARALGNLAEDELSVLVMEEIGIISELVKLFIKTIDVDCQQSVLRALRMVCTTPERKKAVLDFDAVKTIVDLLKSERKAMVNCCIRAVAELTKGCSKEIAQQVQDHGGVKNIVELAKDRCPQVRHSAIMSLANLACHAHVRVCIGIEGGIEALTQLLTCNESGHVVVKAIEGICLCCREGINRARVFESGALELLLKMLSSGLSLSLEKKIVFAFTHFYYYDSALEVLLNGDLVPALITHLNTVLCHLLNQSEGEDHDHDDISDQLSFSSDFSSNLPRSTTAKDSFFDSSSEALKDETLLKKYEETAREAHVWNSKVSGKLSNFKRRMKLKPTPIPTTPPRGVCTVGSGPSVFSFASEQTDTTSLVSVCTYSRSISSLASSSNCQKFPNTGVCCWNQGVLTSSQVSAPMKSQCFSDEQPSDQPTNDLVLSCSLRETGIPKYDGLLMPSESVVPDKCFQAAVTTFSSPNTTNGGLPSPLSPRTHSLHHHHRSPGHSCLVLLFRISLMTDPSSLLVNKPCIQVLLDYLCLVDNPSPKCVRILSHLVSNPLCLRTLIVSGAVTAIHHQLCCICDDNQGVASAINQCTSDAQKLQSSLDQTSDAGPKCSMSMPDTKKVKCPIKGEMFHHMSSGIQTYCNETGKNLLKTLENQAQSPFGKGILENLLHKGSDEEVKECLLALPLLCRTKKMKQQMLGERKALKKFCGLFSSAPPSSKTFTFAAESLIVLANDLKVQFPPVVVNKEERALFDLVKSSDNGHSVQTGDNSVELHAAKKLKLDFTSLKETQPCVSMNFKNVSLCQYETNSYSPSDVKFQMDSGDVFSAHKHIMKGASEVFNTMFSSDCYLESTQSVIAIHEVSADVFQFSLHLIYGCASLLDSAEALLHSSHNCNVLHSIQRKGKEVEFFLELLEFSNRFMLDQVKTVSEEALVNIIDENVVVQICVCSLRLNSPLLCHHCLAYLVKVNISELPARLYLFKELFLCTDRGDLVDHLYQFLLLHLKEHELL
ncbi:armadillo repeat-containing protein 5-like [Montipora foliosa]|uniref:armadillo repeat-containing protein 5-like n=1 Tax=Montipora foliosa TaxID=591990 RepID=UPI0035F17B08